MTEDIAWPGMLLLLSCLLAAGYDLYSRRIPNLLCLVTALAGAAFAWSLSGMGGLGWHAAHAVVALLVGMALFGAGVIGGGDAKFYAATAMWFPLSLALRLLLLVSMAGIVLLLFWIVVRRLTRKPWRTRSGNAFDSLPYGVAIGTGALAAFVLN